MWFMLALKYENNQDEICHFVVAEQVSLTLERVSQHVQKC